MTFARIALLSLACFAPLAASAQWQWLDKDGRKVFSDQAPPADVPATRILRQPGSRAATAIAPAPAEAPQAKAGAGVDPALKPAGKDKALEDKRKEKESAEAQKKKAEEEKLAQARDENCRRSRAGKATFDSGVRIAFTNDKGEKEYMDDARRAAEVKRLDALIARDCRQDRQ